MKKLIKLLFFVLIITSFSCETELVEEVSLEDFDNEINYFDGEFGAEEFDALEKEALENEGLEKSKRFYRYAFSKEPVINPILDKTTGYSILIRGKRGVFVKYRTNNLKPGYAYTLWWVIWNKPKECLTPNACGDPEDVDFFNPKTEVDLLYASGQVIRSSGKGTFYAMLRTGDDSESINDLMGNPPVGGIQKGKTFNSEVHLVIRSHGPAIPGKVYEQISGYLGGCTDPFAFPPFTQIPDAIGECGDIEFSVHSPVGK